MQTASSVIGGSGLDWGVVGNLLVALFTLLLAVVAVFQQQIHRWLRRPILRISTTNEPPDSHKTALTIRKGDQSTSSYGCYYSLLRVENAGRLRAEQVEVFVSEILREEALGKWVPLKNFLPQRLLWSFERTPYLASLAPGTFAHCTLGHVLHPSGRQEASGEDPNQTDFWGKHVVTENETVFSLDVQFRSNNLSYLLIPGKYRLRVLLASSQTKALTAEILVDLSGNWFDEEDQMLNKGITIEVR
ncbi:hypothetical protein ACFLSZ_06050 [Candidatus Bipolaricaulota bacterium]